MSLFKQITLIMSLFLLLVLSSVIFFNFQSAKKYAQEEMANNAQNAATYLSLSLAGSQGNVSKMKTMIDAIFDSGYFQDITLNDTQGGTLHQRQQESDLSAIPEWFLSLYTLETPVAQATVSSGWNPIGTIRVTPVQDNAHLQLYTNFKDLLQSFIIISLIAFITLFLLLRLILSSLKRVTEQAEAVIDNTFIINEAIPNTTEFKDVTLAMNKMVAKVKEIFEKEAASVQDYHKLLYTDELTGLGNKHFFAHRLNDLLSSQEVDSSGIALTLYLDGAVQANKSIGHEKVDALINELAQIVKKACRQKDQTIISRIDGTKISMILPSSINDELDELRDTILSRSLISLEKASLLDSECAIKLIQFTYTPQDTVEGIYEKIQDELLTAPKNTYTDISGEEVVDESITREVLEHRINENSIALALQDVYDTHNDILHSEAYVRLYDEEKNLHEAGSFIPLVHKMRLDTKLDQNVINYALKEENLQSREIAFNLSLRFLQDAQCLKWLKERLASVQGRSLSFEISNYSLLNSLNEALILSDTLREGGHYFGIDRFSIEEGTNLNYLQMLKPHYLKIDSAYLLELLQGEKGQTNHALKILIESLEIRIIASNLERQEVKDALENIGISYFQGSLLSTPKLV